MDITETVVREWVEQAERDEGVRADGQATVDTLNQRWRAGSGASGTLQKRSARSYARGVAH